ncbi:MAG: hypothetical protein ABTQ34_00510 [Bdellovibrionales bacterium]
MRLGLLLSCLALVLVLGLAACGGRKTVAQFWRPISEPNIEMALDQSQRKLTYDISQCRCGVYPTNAFHSENVQFQRDKQRLAETGVTFTPNSSGECKNQPGLVLVECMRQRGWEPTNCSGRMPMPNGGSACSGFAVVESD